MSLVLRKVFWLEEVLSVAGTLLRRVWRRHRPSFVFALVDLGVGREGLSHSVLVAAHAIGLQALVLLEGSGGTHGACRENEQSEGRDVYEPSKI